MRESIPMSSDLDDTTGRTSDAPLYTGSALLARIWDRPPGDTADPRAAGHWRPAT